MLVEGEQARALGHSGEPGEAAQRLSGERIAGEAADDEQARLDPEYRIGEARMALVELGRAAATARDWNRLPRHGDRH